MKTSTVCSKCNGPMTRGFVPDFFTHGATRVPGWQEGEPEKSFWCGTNADRSSIIPISAFRCDRCGFLEFYANPEFAAK
jgi:hypothetical protein